MASVSNSITKSITVNGINFSIVFNATFSTSDGLTVTANIPSTSYGSSLTDGYSNSWSASNGASGTYKLGTLSRGSTKTIISNSTGFNSGAVSVTFKFYNSNYEFTISASLGSDAVAGKLSCDSTKPMMTSSVNFYMTGGSNVSYSLVLYIGSATIQTGLTQSGSYTFSGDIFEKYIPATSSSVTVYATLYSTSTITSELVGMSSLTLTLTDTVYPYWSSKHESYLIDAVGGSLVAGKSSVKFVTTLSKYFSDTKATITDFSCTATFTGATINPVSFTSTTKVSGDNIIVTSIMNGTLPIPTDNTATQYKMTFAYSYTDSRGNVQQVAYSTEYVIFCYVTPVISSFEVSRCDSTGAITPSGTYAYATIKVSSNTTYTVSEATVTVNDSSYTLTSLDNLTFTGVVGAGSLETSSQYSTTGSVRTADMKTYNDSLWVSASSVLPTMQLPISFYDDGDQVGVSFGEMSQRYSGVSGESVVNFAKGLTLRATNTSDNTIATCDAYDLVAGTNSSQATVFVQTTTDIPSKMKEGDILVVYSK